MKLTKIFLDRPLLANLVTVLVIVSGLLSLSQLKKSTYPDVNFDILKITTTYPGASAKEVEVKVTKKIEENIIGLEGVDRVISISAENFSSIVLWIDLNYKYPEKAKDAVNRAVDRVSNLPEGIQGSPEIEEYTAANVPVIEVALQGKMSELELRTVARDLKDNLKEISGVSKIDLIGYRKREVQVLADPDKLSEKWISLSDVIFAIQSQNLNLPGGALREGNIERKVVTQSEIVHPIDIKDLIIRSNDSGQRVAIQDVATIVDGFEKHKIISRTEQTPSINLVVKSTSNGDVIKISEEIENILADLRESSNGKLEVKIVRNFAQYVVSLLDVVTNNAYLGFGLVFMSLMFFLNRYAAFWTALGIPLSILGAIIFFPMIGININFIPLITMILVLGLIVDDAIVVSENICRHREMGKNIKEAALDGAKEVCWPVITTIITTILAFVPIMFMSGITGRFIQEIPKIVILALLFSLFESLVILPSHIANGPKIDQRTIVWFEKIKDIYGKVITWALKYRAKALIVFCCFLFFAGLLFHLKMKFILFPYSDADIFYVMAEMPEGTSMKETSDKIRSAEKIIASIPDSEMVSFTTRVGHHHIDVYSSELSALKENWALITVYLKLAADRKRTSEEIIKEVEGKLKENITGFTRLDVMKYYDGPPVGRPITLTLVSDEDDLREKYVDMIFKHLKGIKGVKNLELDVRDGKEEIRIRPIYDKMARLGITSTQLSHIVRSGLEGLVATSITRSGEEIDFRVKLDDSKKNGIEILSKLEVPNQMGRLIKLSSFVEVSRVRGVDQVIHYNGRQSVTINGDVDDKVITSSEVNSIVRDKFSKLINQETGVSIIFGGEEKSTKESLDSLAIAFGITFIAIYFILSVLFNSIWQPFLILSVIPFGLCGVILSFFLHGKAISFFAMIGSMGLMGILVNDSLIMVSHLNQLTTAEGLNFKTLVKGSKDRFRAVILTTVSTVAGMVPTIYGLGGDQPFLVPLVLSIAGGLIFGTTITLILIPLLYSFKIKESVTN